MTSTSKLLLALGTEKVGREERNPQQTDTVLSYCIADICITDIWPFWRKLSSIERGPSKVDVYN